MDSTQSETEKIRMALQVLYGGELDEILEKLLAMPIDLEHYKTVDMKTKEFLGGLDRTQRERWEAFMKLDEARRGVMPANQQPQTPQEKSIMERFAQLRNQNSRNQFTPIFDFEDNLVASYISEMKDSMRWKKVALALMKKWFDTLEASFDKIKFSADQKETFMHNRTEELAIIKANSKHMGVDFDLEKTMKEMEDKKERVEAKVEVIAAEVSGGVDLKSEMECYQAVKRFYARGGVGPNHTQFWKEIAGYTYDRDKALKRLIKRGVLVEVKGERRAKLLKVGEVSLVVEPLIKTHKVQLTRDLAENEGENGQ